MAGFGSTPAAMSFISLRCICHVQTWQERPRFYAGITLSDTGGQRERALTRRYDARFSSVA